MLREVEVECLPDDIPEAITVDVTPLALGQSLRVSELAHRPKVKVLTDANRVVAHVVTHQGGRGKAGGSRPRRLLLSRR